MIPFDERIKIVLSALGTTAYKFANAHAGFNKVSMFNMLSPDKRPSFEMLERLCIAEPRISAEYLLRGEGEPLRDEQRASALSTVEELRAFKEQMDTAIEKRIQELRGNSSD